MDSGARSPAESGPAILDVGHLGRQTAGNRDLQREVLVLFAEQAERTRRLIKTASAADRREAAHALVGAARGIGAFVVAQAAGAVEAGGGSPAQLAALDAAIADALAAITAHLSD